MRDERVEALEVEERLDIAAAGGIAIVDGRQIRAERAPQLRAVLQHLRERLADQASVHIGMVQALREAVADRVLQPRLAEDGRIDEAAERRLAVGRVLGLTTDLLPDRIDRCDVGSRRPLRCARHARLLMGSVSQATRGYSGRKAHASLEVIRGVAQVNQ